VVKEGDCDGGKKLAIDDVKESRNIVTGVDVRGGAYIGVLSKGNLQVVRDIPEVVHRGVQVSEDSLVNSKGSEHSRQKYKISEEQLKMDGNKVFNSILEVIAEEELEKDVSEDNGGKYSVDWAQMFASRFNKNLVHASSGKHGVSERQVTKSKSVLKGVEKLRSVDLGKKLGMCKNEVKNESGCSGFAGWDSIEVLGDNSVGVKTCMMNEESDSGDEGMFVRHRFRRGMRISERGKGGIIEV
jgi:hypothetical protein